MSQGSPTRALLLAFLAGPIIWSIYHLAGYILGEFGCRARFLTGRLMGLPLLSIVLIGLAIVALLATLYAAYWSYQRWRLMREEPGWVDEYGRFSEGRAQFLLFSAVLLNTLFASIILMAGISLLLLEPCQWI
jgi:hypothetical protein